MKKTIIVLLAALALLALALLKHRGDQRKNQSDSFVLDSTRISEAKSLRIVKRPDTSTLAVKDGKWTVANDGFPVDTAKINKVLKYLFSLQNKEIASRNPPDPNEYGLDTSEAKHIAIRNGSGAPMAEVVIGKTSGADYNSTYWKWEGKPEVYRTPGNFTWEIAIRDNDWKDRKLFTLEAKDVKTVETIWSDSAGSIFHYKLEAANDSTWKLVDPADTGKVKKQPAVEMAARFVDISIDDFVTANDTNVAKVKAANIRWTWVKAVLKDGRALELNASKPIEGSAYVRHPSQPVWIKLSSWRFDVFRKKPAELMEGYVAPTPASEKPAKGPGQKKPTGAGKKSR